MKRGIHPSSRAGWWSLGLAVAVVVVGALITSLPALLHPLVERRSGPHVPVGLTSVILECVLAAGAIVTAVIAFRAGERSWLALGGFVLAVAVGGFWLLFGAGELLAL